MSHSKTMFRFLPEYVYNRPMNRPHIGTVSGHILLSWRVSQHFFIGCTDQEHKGQEIRRSTIDHEICPGDIAAESTG